MKGAERAAKRADGIHLIGSRKRTVAVKEGPCLDIRIGLINAGKRLFDKGAGCHLAIADQLNKLFCRCHVTILSLPPDGIRWHSLDIFTKQIVRKPQRNSRELIQQNHREDDDAQIGKNALEDIDKLDLPLENALQIIG